MGDSTTNSAPEQGIGRESRTPDSMPKQRDGRGRSTLREVILPGVLPTVMSLITAVFGFYIWKEQNKIQQTVDNNSRIIQTRLSLSEEFYKGRLAVYTDTCKEIVAVKDALDQAHLDEAKQAATDRLIALDQFRRSRAIYLSDRVANTLHDMWASGTNLMQHLDDEKSEGLKDEIAQSIALAHTYMKEDLSVKELSQFPWRVTAGQPK